MAWQKTCDGLVNEERYTDRSDSKWRKGTRRKKPDPICLLADSFGRPVLSEETHHYSLHKQEVAKGDDEWRRTKDGTSGAATRATVMDGQEAVHHAGRKEGEGGLDPKMGHRSRKLVFRSGYRLSKEVNEHIFYTVLKLPQWKNRKRGITDWKTFFFIFINQPSEYEVFYKLIYWLGV
jgi:hypothetical protein